MDIYIGCGLYIYRTWIIYIYYVHDIYKWILHPVFEKMRVKKLVEMQIEFLDGQSSGLFSNEPFEKRPVMTIENVVLHFNDHFESHLLGNGLYMCAHDSVWNIHIYK